MPDDALTTETKLDQVRAALVAPPRVPDHELIRRIGGGSYGEVWLARSVLGAPRAVKVVYRDRFDHERPYEREFKGIQRFEPISRSHEGLVDVLQVGRNDSDGYFYYVMELADAGRESEQVREWKSGKERTDVSSPGPPARLSAFSPANYVPRTLRRELYHRGRLPFNECLELSVSLARAVAHLHQHGLVHRDIKPSNIIFVNGVPKLADIGLVAEVGRTVSFVGTEGFIPPEGPGTIQADIYSLGKVLYEIASGHDRQDFPELPTTLRGSPDES